MRRIIAGEAALAARDLAPRDPATALLAAAADADAILQQLKAMLARGAIDDGVVSVVGDWIDRTARISKLVIDAKLDERRVQVEEAQARMVVIAFGRAMDVLDATAAQREEGVRVLVADLRRTRSGSESAGDRGGQLGWSAVTAAASPAEVVLIVVDVVEAALTAPAKADASGGQGPRLYGPVLHALFMVIPIAFLIAGAGPGVLRSHYSPADPRVRRPDHGRRCSPRLWPRGLRVHAGAMG